MTEPFRITIYALTDPDTGAVRYVGKTQQRYLSGRIGQHVVEARLAATGSNSCTSTVKTPRIAWILGLLARGKRPAIRELESVAVTSNGEALAHERRWIDIFVEEGASLLNADATPEARAARTARRGMGERIRRVAARRAATARGAA